MTTTTKKRLYSACWCIPALILGGYMALHVGAPAPAAAQPDAPAVEETTKPPAAVDQDPRSERLERRKEREERMRQRRGERGERRHRHGERHGREKAGRVGKFLQFVNSYIDTVQDPYRATGLAVLGIKDYHKRAGNPAGAMPELEKLLSETGDQRMRNILLFAMRQVAEESDQREKFLELNRQIIRENIKQAR